MKDRKLSADATEGSSTRPLFARVRAHARARGLRMRGGLSGRGPRNPSAARLRFRRNVNVDAGDARR